MGWKVNNTSFRVNVKIDTFGEKKGNFETVDIVSYTVIRAPLLKSIPIATLVLDLDPKFSIGIQEKISKNIFPVCTVTIENGDGSTADKANNRQSSTKSLTNVNLYKIVEVIDLENLPSASTMMKRIKLVMIDSLLHWIGHSNGFSKTIRDKTGYEVLQEYEGYLFSEFGGGDTFDPPKHIIGETNSFKHKRIHLSETNDLLIPQYLISMYKPLVNFCYYFLDTFRSLEEGKRRILRLFVDFNSLESFEKWDITENGHEDMAMNYIITRETLVDKLDKFTKHGDYAKVLIDKHGRYRRKLPTSPVSVPYYISKESDAFHKTPHGGGRGGGSIEKFHPISTSEASKNKPPKESEVIRVSDNYAIGESRAEANKKIVRTVIESFDTYRFPNAQPNSIEFQRRYNLDKYAPQEYKRIPIHITNEFTKLNPKEAKYIHSAVVKFIKYS